LIYVFQAQQEKYGFLFSPIRHNWSGSLAWIWPDVVKGLMHGSNLALVRFFEGIEALSGKV